MTALPGARRKRTALMLTANVLAVGLLAGMGYAGVAALRDYKGAERATTESIGIPVTPVGMLATVDDNDRLTAVTVMVLTQAAEGAQVGGSIITVPVSSDATAGGADVRTPLAQVYTDGGSESLLFAVESLLSITVDVGEIVTPRQLVELLQPVAPIGATLPTDVLDADGDLLFGAGDVSLTADQAAALLTEVADDQVDLDRRGNIDALWTGVAAAIGAGRTSPDVSQPITTVAQLVERLFAGPTAARLLPATPLPEGEQLDGVDVEVLDRAEAIFVLAAVAPASMSAPSPGLVFRLEAPAGSEERMKVAVAAILYLGGNVQWVYLEGGVHPETRILVADESLAEDASSSNAYFGNTKTLAPDTPYAGIDVIVQLGTEFLEGDSDELPSTTSTTEPT